MRWLSFFSRRVLENPHIGRQLARFSPLGLGSVLFLVAGGLLFADFLVFRNLFLEDSSWLPEAMAGSVLHLVNSQLLYGFLALLLPMRLAGAIDGSRADRSFDQIVVTGWSPWSLHAGNWGLGLGHAAVILTVSLPFQAFAYTLGGVTVGEIVTAYLVLAIYSNVIIGTTLALAMGERERIVVPTSIFIFCLAGFVCLFSPAPGVLGEATPLRFLARHAGVGGFLYPYLLAAPASVMLFSWSLPIDVYQFLLWGFVLLPACVVLLLGPSHRFTPGLNNFGAVTIAGDRWRRLFRRQSLALARKVELAFFYENRPRWLDGWDFILRKVPIFAWLGLLWGIVQGQAFRGAPLIEPGLKFFRDLPFLVSIGGTAAFAFLALLALGDTRHRAGIRERIGPRELPRGLLLSALAVLVLAGFVLLHWRTLDAAIDASRTASVLPVVAAPDLAAAREAARDHAVRLDAYVKDWSQLVAAVTLFLLNCHLIGKLLSLVAGSMHAFGFGLVAITCVLLFAPGIVWLGIDEGWLPSALFPLIFLTPLVLLAMQGADLSAAASDMGYEPGADFTWFVGLHLALGCSILALLAFLGWRRRARARRSVLHATPVPVAAALLVAIVSLASPSAMGMETLPLDVQVIHGFEGHLLNEGVDFFTLIVKNTSSRDIRGSLRVEAGDPPEDLCAPRPFEAPASTTTVLRWSENTGPGKDFSGARFIFEAPGGILGVELPVAAVVATAQRRGAAQESAYLIASAGARLPALVKSDHKWVACSPFSLPEDLRAYGGAAVVFIGPTDLSAWTKGQRDALQDYIRLGGAVVFYGTLDRASLQGAPEWSALIGGKRGASTIGAGIGLAVEEIDEGKVVWSLAGADGEPPAPLLTVRSVGPGRLAHMAFDLASGPEALGARLGGATAFWTAFESHVPRSAYLAALVLPSSWGSGAALFDPGPLLAVLLYFILYMAFIGPGLILGFRKKSRRRWVVAYVVGLSLLFVAAIPLLEVFLHLKPSYAAINRAAYFGPGARRGVVQGCLRVRSSGRQSHRVRIEAQHPSAYFFTPGVDSRFREIDAITREPGRLAGPLDLGLPPWGSRRVLITGDAVRAEPITGSVILYPGRGSGSLRAEGLPAMEEGGSLTGRLLLFEATSQGEQSIDLLGASVSRGKITMEFNIGKLASANPGFPGGRHSLLLQNGLQGSFVVAGGMGPRAVLAFIAKDVPLAVDSADLAFEREVSTEQDPGKGLRPPSGIRMIDRGGTLYRSFEGVLILQELTVEIQ